MSALDALLGLEPAPSVPAGARGFLFPGQGSQFVGMGADLHAASPTLDRLLERTRELTGHDVARTMLRGPKARLDRTVATQLSVFVLSTAIGELLRDHGLEPTVVAGHSLGEFSALVCGGWLDFDAAVVAVARRAEAMAECCAARPGAMSAVIGLAPDTLEELRHGLGEPVWVANRNSARQAVIAGEPVAVGRLGAAAAAADARAVIPLNVAGAFHTPLMAPAEAAFAPVVERLPLCHGEVALVSSVTGEHVDDVEGYRVRLAGQITAPVQWERVLHALRPYAVGGLVEVGPGDALRGLVRHLDRRIDVVCCDGLAACRRLLETSRA